MAGLLLFLQDDTQKLVPVEVGVEATVADVIAAAGPQFANTTLSYQGEALKASDVLADLGVCPQSVIQASGGLAWKWEQIGKAAERSEESKVFTLVKESPDYTVGTGSVVFRAGSNTTWRVIIKGPKRTDMGVFVDSEFDGNLDIHMRGRPKAWLWHLVDEKAVYYGVQVNGGWKEQPEYNKELDRKACEKLAGEDHLYEFQLTYGEQEGTLSAWHKDIVTGAVIRALPPIDGIPDGVRFFWCLDYPGASVHIAP
eukprot:Hpha_TRINITY_DN20044_c0_g1::TRINITY_DN20044_c0_g1_i1::g.147771::m.147771